MKSTKASTFPHTFLLNTSPWIAKNPLFCAATLVALCLFLQLFFSLWWCCIGIGLLCVFLFLSKLHQAHPVPTAALAISTIVLFSASLQIQHQTNQIQEFQAELQHPQQQHHLQVIAFPSLATTITSNQVIAKNYCNQKSQAPLLLNLNTPVALGSTLWVSGTPTTLPKTRNPRNHSYTSWLQQQGVHFQLNGTVLQQEPPSSFHWQAFLTQARVYCLAILTNDLPLNSGRELLPALTFGIHSEVSPLLKEQFRHAGTFHLFAISGLHIGLAGILLLFLFRPLQPQWRFAFVLIVLFFFVSLTGLRPSALRAWVMFAVFSIGILRGHKPFALNAVGLAAIIELAIHPQHLFDLGFQFSYLVVLGILLICPLLLKPISQLSVLNVDPFLPRKLERKSSRIRRKTLLWISNTGLVSFVAWLSSLPVQIKHFGILNPMAPLANLFLVPSAIAALFSSLSGLMLSLIWQPLGWPLRRLSQFICSLASLTIQQGEPYLFCQKVDQMPAQTTRLTKLDLLHGSCQLLEHENYTILVDCGHQSHWEKIVHPFLNYRAIDQIDLLILTHADANHISALASLLEEVEVSTIALSPYNFRAIQTLKNLSYSTTNLPSVQYITAGDQAYFAEASLSVLHPPANEQLRRADDRAIVFLFTFAKQQWLFTSDANWHTESVLQKNLHLYPNINLISKDNSSSSSIPHPEFWLKLSKNRSTKTPLIQLTNSPSTTWLPQQPYQAKWLQSLDIETFSLESSGAIFVENNADNLTINNWLTQEKHLFPQR